MKSLIILALFISQMAFAKETRKKIVVIDTGISQDQINQDYMCKNGAVSTVPMQPKPTHSLKNSDHEKRMAHGQNIVGLISTRIDKTKYCIYSIRVFSYGTDDGYIPGLKHASTLKNVVGLNLSLSGPDSYMPKEHAYITRFLIKGVKVIVSSGNNKRTIKSKECSVWPACFKAYYDTLGIGHNFHVVTAPDVSEANMPKGVIMYIQKGFQQGNPAMTGTSQATAIFTGLEFSK